MHCRIVAESNRWSSRRMHKEVVQIGHRNRSNVSVIDPDKESRRSRNHVLNFRRNVVDGVVKSQDQFNFFRFVMME